MKKIFALEQQKKWLLGGFLLLGLVSFIFSTPSAPEKISDPLVTPTSVDTFIPAGYVLVPIELSNAESLSSLVGDVGCVVDLYLATQEKKTAAIKVGSKVKMIRAPLNPQQYAVLVKDQESSAILNYSGPFVAVVQNPNAQGQKVKSLAPATVKVEYQPSDS